MPRQPKVAPEAIVNYMSALCSLCCTMRCRLGWLPAATSAIIAPEAVAAGAELLLVTRRQTQTQPPQMLLRAVSAESAAAASADAQSDEARRQLAVSGQREAR